ncbi:MAG: hypothetical protein Q9161_004009 [Pseudevernia consocians]
MPYSVINQPTGSVMEAYVILLNRLADSVYGFFTALGYITLYTTAIAAFSIVCLLAPFYIIVTSLIGVTPRQEAGSTHVRTTAKVQSDPRGLLHEMIAATVDKSQANLPSGSPNNNTVVKINRHIDARPTELPPAIPPYLKDCEFYYNTVDMNLIENYSLCLKGRLQVVRLTIDKQCISNGPGYIKMVLENLERGRMPKLSKREGVFERSKNKKAMLELRNKVYVGPAEWLLRVLEEA